MEALLALRDAAMAQQLPQLDDSDTITLGDRPFQRCAGLNKCMEDGKRLCQLRPAGSSYRAVNEHF